MRVAAIGGTAMATLAALVAPIACTLALKADDLQSGACDDGMKACRNERGLRACVSVSDPTYGCASDDCRACNYDHAKARCGPRGECQLAACIGKFDDCDGDPANGCEVDKAFDPKNCGHCGKLCSVTAGKAACADEVCAVASCDEGFSDCNHDGKDGCEVHGICAAADGGALDGG